MPRQRAIRRRRICRSPVASKAILPPRADVLGL
jgi:hypothetical protein